MKTLKIINISLCLVAIIGVWLTTAENQNKIVVSILLFIIILFWLSAKGGRRFDNNKFIG